MESENIASGTDMVSFYKEEINQDVYRRRIHIIYSTGCLFDHVWIAKMVNSQAQQGLHGVDQDAQVVIRRTI